MIKVWDILRRPKVDLSKVVTDERITITDELLIEFAENNISKFHEFLEVKRDEKHGWGVWV